LLKQKRAFFRDGRRLRTRFRLQTRIAALAVLWSIATTALGANWFFQPAATVGTGYEENADLEEEDPIDTTRYELAVEARGGRLTERSQLVGALRASRRRHPGHEDLDSDNLSAMLSSAFLPTELDRLTLDLGFARDTTRTSELTTTGDISGNVPRDTIRFAPAWEHQLTERSSFGLAYAHTRTSFDNNDSGFVDSKEDGIDAFYSYRLTEQLALRGTLGATSYDPDDGQSYKDYEALLGAGYAFSETLTGNLDVGWQRIDRDTDLEEATTERSASGTVYGFSLSKAFERSNLGLSLRRSAVPTGTGEPVTQESLGLGYAYRFSPRVSVTIPIGVYRSKSVSFDDTAEDDETRIFVTAEPSLSWRVTEDIVLRASYRYQYERFKVADTIAEGNAVFLSFSYLWPTEIPGLAP